MKRTTIKIITTLSLSLFSTMSLLAFDIKGKSGEQDTKLQIFGFSQLEARGGDGVIDDDQDASVKFGAQRVRLGWQYSVGRVKGKVFLDFNQAHNDKSKVGLPNMIKDAFITYIPHKAIAVKVGLIKMPMGLGFTIPGWNLDVVERGFDKQLAFERGMGIMLSGRDLGFGNDAKVSGFEMGHERPWKGFGYDIMIANQAGRSGSVTEANLGDANAYVARVSFDWTELLHTELSYGLSEKAGGVAGTEIDGVALTTDSRAYKALNFGVDSHFGDGANLKFEYYDAKNIRGADDWDESTIAITGTYHITDTVELATKYIQGVSDKSGVETDLSNTYIGFNYYLEPANNKMSRSEKRKRNAHRVQVNYVLASGDTDWNGLKGYTDDAILAQYQFKF